MKSHPTGQVKDSKGNAIIMLVVGFCLCLISYFLKDTLTDAGAVIIQIVGIVLVGWSIAQLLWSMRHGVRMRCGPLMVIVGLGVLLVCWLLIGNLPGMIAGGFIAVVGAILSLKHKG